MALVKTYRLLENGSYELEIQLDSGDVRSFTYAAVPVESGEPIMTPDEYEAMQLREVKALLDSEQQTGTPLAAEGEVL